MSKAGFTYDTVDPGDSAKGNVILLDRRIGLTPIHRRRRVVAGPRPGTWDFGTELDERAIELDLISGDNTNTAGTDVQMRALADLFDPTNEVSGDKGFKQLVFDSEPDKYWLAKLIDGPFPEYLPSAGRLRLTLRCNDPFAYSTGQYVVQGGSATLSGFSAYRQIPERLGWNLVKNGGFVVAVGSEWTLHANASRVTDATSVTGFSLRLIATASGQQSFQQFSIEAGKSYSFAIQAKGDGVAQLYVAVQWYDAGNQLISEVGPLAQATQSAWTEYTLANQVAPGNARLCRVYMQLQAAGIGFWTALRVKQQTAAPAAWSAADQQILGNKGLAIFEATTNKVDNGDFESALSSGVYGLKENLATLNEWAVETGSTFTLAANVATNPDAATNRMLVGPPSNEWRNFVDPSQFHFVWAAGGTTTVYIRWVDASNWIAIEHDGATFYLKKRVAGSTSTVYSVADALSAGTWVWFAWTISGTSVTARRHACSTGTSAGNIAAQVQTSGAQTISDGALTFGRAAVQMTGSNALAFGGTGTDPVSFSIAANRTGLTLSYTTVNDLGRSSYFVSESAFFAGSKSIGIRHSGTGNKNGFWGQNSGVNATPVSASTKYTFSARILLLGGPLAGGGRVALRVIEFTSGGALVLDSEWATATAAADWTTLSATVQTQPTTAFCELRLMLATVAQVITVRFDNVGFEQKAYDTLNADPSALAYVATGSRTASSDTETLESGFDVADFGRTVALRPDHANNGGPAFRTLWQYRVDASNVLELYLGSADGRIYFYKTRAAVTSSVNDGGATAFAAGDSLVIGIRHSAAVGLEMQVAKNGGAVATYTNVTPEAKMPIAGTPTSALGYDANGGAQQTDGAVGIDRHLKAGVTAAQVTTSVQNPYAQQDEAYESVVYRFDGAAVVEDYASGTLHVDVGGSYWTYPVIELTAGGAYTGNLTVTDAGGNVFTWNGTLALNDVLKIDTAAFRAYLNGGISMSGVLNGSKWPVLIPNQRNEIVIGGIAAANIKALKTTFRNRWI